MGVFNLPTVTTDDLTAGPGRVFLGASGATPTVDVGTISEDGGVELTIKNVKVGLRQGNPSVEVHAFNQSQDLSIKFTGMEWNFTNLSYALGAGLTASDGSSEQMDFGGDATVDTVAIHARHEMLGGDTMNLYAWQCRGASDEIAIKWGQEYHEFPYEFMLQRVTTSWGGASLSNNNQLFRLYRQTV